jgi:hypothetical protein
MPVFGYVGTPVPAKVYQTEAAGNHLTISQSQKGGPMATPKTPPRKVIYRNSVNGQIVTQRYAENHPRTTERQHVDIRNPKK